MIEKIFVILGLVLFVNQLFEKWNLWERIQFFGSNSRFMTIYKLTSCRFCLMFHISWILTTIYCLFESFSWGVVSVPFVVSGLIQIILKNDL